jgi:hypothetical protein
MSSMDARDCPFALNERLAIRQLQAESHARARRGWSLRDEEDLVSVQVTTVLRDKRVDVRCSSREPKHEHTRCFGVCGRTFHAFTITATALTCRSARIRAPRTMKPGVRHRADESTAWTPTSAALADGNCTNPIATHSGRKRPLVAAPGTSSSPACATGVTCVTSVATGFSALRRGWRHFRRFRRWSAQGSGAHCDRGDDTVGRRGIFVGDRGARDVWALIGDPGTPMGSSPPPGLTTIRRPRPRLGERARRSRKMPAKRRRRRPRRSRRCMIRNGRGGVGRRGATWDEWKAQLLRRDHALEEHP